MLAGLTFVSAKVSRGMCACVAGIVVAMQAYSIGLYHFESWDGMPVVEADSDHTLVDDRRMRCDKRRRVGVRQRVN